MRSNIKIGLFQLAPTALLALLDNVLSKMNGNPLFPAPPRPYVEMSTLSAEFRRAIDDATDGGLIARKHRDVKVEETRDVLRSLCDYVRTVCNGREDELVQSGFPLAKRPQPINEVGVPPKLVAKATDSTSQLRLRWGKTIGAHMFRVERAISDPVAGETTWHPIGFTSRQSFVVTGLQPYAPYWFRVVAFGKTSEGLPSDVVLGRAA